MSQDELLEIFNKLKPILSKYVPPLVALKDYESKYEIEFDKDYEIRSERTGKVTKKHGMYFAGVIIQSTYVGFYFMPIYADKDKFSDAPDWVMKMLKGKSCFHIKAWSDELGVELENMVALGYKMFDKM